MIATLLALTVVSGPPVAASPGTGLRLEDASFGVGVAAVSAEAGRLELEPAPVPVTLWCGDGPRRLAPARLPVAAARAPLPPAALAARLPATVDGTRWVAPATAWAAAPPPWVQEGVWRPG